MQKWEYCNVVSSYGSHMFNKLSVNGTKFFSAKMDKAKGDQYDSDARDRLIAQLGQEGWEMVSIIERKSLEKIESDYWFKRLIKE